MIQSGTVCETAKIICISHMEPVQVSCQAPGQTRDLFLMLAITGEFTHKWDAAFSLGRQWLAAIPALLELGNTNLAGALQPAWGRASAFANLQTLLIYNSSVTGRLGRLCLI